MKVVASLYDWEVQQEPSSRADIYIVVKEDDICSRLQRLKRRQRLSRIPGMREVCKKVSFAALMQRMQSLDPDYYDFWPETCIVSQDSLIDKALTGPFIFKPDDGCGGDGIFVLLTASDLQRRVHLLRGTNAVVQEYIPNPLLLQGFKWDVRVYVLVLSLEPLRTYLCSEGIARVCSEAYTEPTARTVNKVNCHLTNYSINKFGTNYNHRDDPSDGTAGTKRTLSSVMRYLATMGHDVKAFQEQIYHISSATVEALATEFADCDVLTRRNCFHILGLDIIFDANGKAWLLEVNSSPSLSIDSVFPVEGPYAESPSEIPEGSMHAPLMHSAKAALGRGCRETCRCSSHHRPHLHAPCAVDLVAKAQVVVGTLEILHRDMGALDAGQLDSEALAAGTSFQVLHAGIC